MFYMKSEARPDNQQLVEEDRARSCPRKRSAFVAALRSSRASFDTLKRRAIANTNTSKLMDDTAHHREGAGLNSEKTTDFASDNTTGTSDEKQSIAIFSAAASPLSASWRKEPLSSTETSKVIQILQACKDHDRDALVALATTENGFVEDEVRRITWPILLGSGLEKHESNWHSLPPHRDETQVALDVNRAFVYYPTGETEKQIDARKAELSNLITEVLRRHPSLCYFQGYHDIAQVLLLVLGANTAAPALARLSLLRIRDFMLPSLTATNAYLGLLPAILRAADPELFAHLAAADVQPHYAIAATLTLYAHDIEEYGSIARLFDFLLAREAVVTVYMYAAILISRRKELFQFEADEPEMLYVTMSKLPKPLNLEALISRTTSLFAQHPPESLPFRAWSRVSGNSVLKTTRDPQKLIKQSLEDGETYFRKHTAEIERQEARQKMLQQTRSVALKYRRPAGALGFAIVVGILSVWLGRNGQLTGSSIFDGLRYRVWDVFNLLLRR